MLACVLACMLACVCVVAGFISFDFRRVHSAHIANTASKSASCMFEEFSVIQTNTN